MSSEEPSKIEPPPPLKVYPEFISVPVERLHRDFMQFAFNLLLKKDLFWQERKNEPPLRFRKPERLRQLIDFELQHQGISQLKILTLLRKMIFYSANVAHPYFVYQMLSGLEPYSVIGDFIASAISSPMVTYKDAPVYTLMEEEVLKKIRDLVGYPEGEGSGVFLPGSSLANCYALALARHRAFPETKENGMFHLPPLVVFISEEAHYSYIKGGFFEGFGAKNVIKVKVDNKGKMIVQCLEEEVQKCLLQERIPLMVGATAGTTVLGAFDPLEEIAHVCKKYKMWFHIDAAYGGGVIVSKNQRYRLNGMEMSDSFSWSQHKLQACGETCVTFVTRHSNILKDTMGIGYIVDDFGPNTVDRQSFYNFEWNSGEKHIQSSRRPDVMKFWMTWKAHGLDELGQHVDHIYANAKFATEELKRREALNGKFVPLLDEFECTNISFYYIPPYIQKMDKTSKEFVNELSAHTHALMATLTREGIMLIVAQSIRSTPYFFKVVLHSSGLTKEDCVYLLDQIDNYGTNIKTKNAEKYK